MNTVSILLPYVSDDNVSHIILVLLNLLWIVVCLGLGQWGPHAPNYTTCIFVKTLKIVDNYLIINQYNGKTTERISQAIGL